MLDELRVRNLGLLEEARLEPGSGLVVVSGETGTGKTLLLGALELLLGESPRSTQVGPFGPEAVVEGRFLDGDAEVVAGRRLTAGGRTRAYLDGQMVPARVLGDRLGGLVEVVGQDQRLAVARVQELRAMLDGSLEERGLPESYRRAWRRLQGLLEEREELGGDQRELREEAELLALRLAEIERFGLSPDEEESLRLRVARLRHAEELRTALGGAWADLRGEAGAQETIGRAVAGLRTAARMDAGLDELAARAEDLAALATELASDVRRQVDELDLDPEQSAHLEARLARLGDLRRKYGTEDLSGLAARTGERHRRLNDLLERAVSLDTELAEAEMEVARAGSALRSARREAAARLVENAVEHLRDLGLGDPVVEMLVEDEEPGASGADRLELRFASHRDLEPGPVGRVASGGELSRLVLALRLAAGGARSSVMVFDEVDAGLGGAAALALGRKLATLAKNKQVLCVTHLPQVAASADAQFVVEREGNRATVRRVEGKERIAEISRMLAGLPESERGRGHAEELLTLAGKR